MPELFTQPAGDYGDCAASSQSAMVTQHRSFAMNFG
jgi:hypothetical protein